MADLLPSLSSEDDDDDDDNNAVNHHHESSSSSDNGDDEEVIIDKDFEFGGILGEDGGDGGYYHPHPHHYSSIRNDEGERNNPPTSSLSNVPSRMNVEALIAAKRQSILLLLQNKKSKKQGEEINSSSSGDAGSSSKENRQKMDNDDSSSSTSDDDDESSTGSSSSSSEEELEGNDDDSHHDLEEDVLKTRTSEKEDDDDDDDDDDESSESEDDEEERKKEAAFFDNEPSSQQQTMDDDEETTEIIQVYFAQLTLCRPLLRGVAAMGYVQPTPIQVRVIPLALQGRDICASAVTGSGKTAAFVLPVLERLLHRTTTTTTANAAATIKALILTPTRELAAQCYDTTVKLSQFVRHGDIRVTLVTGGTKNLKEQAAELRTRPDIVVATPGRLLDHVTNTVSVTLQDVEFLVLDEADRLLDLGFQDEILELVTKACPINRQTMLFSATMNTKVDDLIHLSLKNPVRVRVSNDSITNSTKTKKNRRNIEVAPRLEQEFVRIRAGNEGIHRQAMLLALLTRTFPKHVIVFFDTKVTAHRLMILAGLCGIKCAELHGNLTQQQRMTALDDFRQGRVDVLLATDLAARGLDIDRVSTVINYEMPSQIETYVHRIGRTARAGRGGRSCTLIGEGRRHLMKEIIKDIEASSSSKRSNGTHNNNNNNKKKQRTEKGVIRSRSIPTAVIQHFAAKIQTLEPHVEEVLQAEAVARMDRIAEMEAIRAQNLIQHADEIAARPQREWFASKQQKRMTKAAAAEKQKMIAEKAGTGVHRMTRKKRRAREVLEAMRAAGSVDDNDDDENEEGKSKPRKTTKAATYNIKADVRKQKKKQAEQERELAGKSIRDHDIEEARREEKSKRRKVATGDAAGDSSLFSEEKVSFLRKEKSRDVPQKSSYHFRGFDPDRKLGKKRGHKKFKSKSKYKRR